eukprot:10366554-Alexandrium_andersonii.AAC.1
MKLGNEAGGNWVAIADTEGGLRRPPADAPQRALPNILARPRWRRSGDALPTPAKGGLRAALWPGGRRAA